MRADGQVGRRDCCLARDEGDVAVEGVARRDVGERDRTGGGGPGAGPVVIVTVAVNVTTWLNTEGFGAAASIVAVSAATTSWSTEPLLVASPVAPP